MTFRPGYALAALILFAIEVCIALFVHDAVIRPYVGDVLAVALVYAAVRGVTVLHIELALILALVIALGVELAQLFNLLDALGLRSNPVAATVLGGSFDWLDLAAYVAGAALILVAEAIVNRLRP